MKRLPCLCRKLLSAAAVLGTAWVLGQGVVHGAQISHIGTNQNVLVICVQYNDEPSTRLATCGDWVNLLNNETNDFYNRATYNQTNFVFETAAGGPADGWYSLGYDSTNYDFFDTGQDAIDLIDPDVDMSRYHRVLVITNWAGFGGQGGGPWWWKTSEGVESTFVESGVSVGKRRMTMAIVNEWAGPTTGESRNYDQAASVASHELGHQLSLPTHYGAVRWHPGLARDTITPWDIMGLSPGINHFIGWAKAQRGWIPGWSGAASPRVQIVGPPIGSDIDTTLTLVPQETTTVAGVQVIGIPFTGGSHYEGYVIENRRRINGDENLPSQGVLISLVSEHPEDILKCIVMEDPGSPGDLDLAPLEVGDTFTDAGRNLTVEVLSQTGNNYRVRIRYLLPASAKPDPMIIPWGAPPHETVDIWIDSERNGWGTYRYTDAGGAPTGNGDDAWVDHDNRVYVRIRNIGPGLATNVRVQVYRNDPPGMGDAGPDWRYLGTIVIPNLPAGSDEEDFVLWKPTVGSHTCLRAIIDDISGELSTTNNRAQENVSHFDTSGGSPFRAVGQKITVYNPFTVGDTEVHFDVSDIPPGWAVLVEPARLTLAGGGKKSVLFMALPSGPPESAADAGSMDQRVGFIGKPRIQAYAPYADTFIPLGGVDLWTHLVRRARLDCETSQMITTTYTQLRGSIDPPIGDAVIALEVASGAGREIYHARTDGRGSFVLTLPKVPPGAWKAWASFAGDSTRSAAEASCFPMPLPTSWRSFPYTHGPVPIVDPQPPGCQPFTGGDIEGGVMTLRTAFPRFTGAADIYLLLQIPRLSPLIWVIGPGLGLFPLGANPPKWRANTTGPVDEWLYQAIPVPYLPSGSYVLGAVVTKAGDLGAGHFWFTQFTVP